MQALSSESARNDGRARPLNCPSPYQQKRTPARNSQVERVYDLHACFESKRRKPHAQSRLRFAANSWNNRSKEAHLSRLVPSDLSIDRRCLGRARVWRRFFMGASRWDCTARIQKAGALPARFPGSELSSAPHAWQPFESKRVATSPVHSLCVYTRSEL